MAGHFSPQHELIVVTFISLMCKEKFIGHLFVRVFVLDTLLKKVRELVAASSNDPTNMFKMRTIMNSATKDQLFLINTLKYLEESLLMIPPIDGMSKSNDPSSPGYDLYKRLDLDNTILEIKQRVLDLDKLLDSCVKELNILQEMVEAVNNRQLENVYRNVEKNANTLVDATALADRKDDSLAVMELILSGSFAFAILDRLSGGSFNIDRETPEWVHYYLIEPIINIPFFWFFLNICFLFLFWFILKLVRDYLARTASGTTCAKWKLNMKIHVSKLKKYLMTKNLEVTDSVSNTLALTSKVTWTEVRAVIN